MRIKIDTNKEKQHFLLKGEIEKNNNFSKKANKKIEIKTMRTKLKNTIPLIWIE